MAHHTDPAAAAALAADTYVPGFTVTIHPFAGATIHSW
jgi:hypothetical protein